MRGFDMRALVIVIASLMLTLVGCGDPAKNATEATRKLMLDPDATQFRGVHQCDGDKSVWEGEANGKNSYGAYVGFKLFMSDGVSAGFLGDLEYAKLSERCYPKPQ
jgi:hypothetical protein